jgi:GNAT superfamily N-acetyltransferase
MSMRIEVPDSPNISVVPLLVYNPSVAEGICALQPQLDEMVSGKLTESRERNLQYMIEHPDTYGQLVAMPDHSSLVLGTVSLSLVRNAGEAPHAQMEGLVVHKDYRCWGIGRTLLRGVDAWCQERDLAYVNTVGGPSATFPLYKRYWGARQVTTQSAVRGTVFRKYYQQSL